MKKKSGGLKFLMISNMYPSKDMPYYGIFVKNFENVMKKFGASFVCKALIKGKPLNLLSKIFKYFLFYLKIFIRLFICKYDVVYVHYPLYCSPAIFLFKLFDKNKKVIFNFHGSDFILEKGDILTKIFWRIMISILKRIDLVVVPSYYFKNVVLSYLNTKKDIYVYPSGGIDLDLFHPLDKNSCRERFKISKTDFVIGWVSRIDKGKGWEIFLKALKILHERGITFKALVAGVGKEVVLFKDMVKRFGLEDKVIYLGGIRHEELVYIYNSCDLFVSSSVRKAESLNLSTLEAMACGVPVVVSYGFGYTDYVKNDFNGLFFKSGSPLDLADKIIHFISLGEEKRLEMSKNALNTAYKYETFKVSKDFHFKLLNFLNEK